MHDTRRHGGFRHIPTDFIISACGSVDNVLDSVLQGKHPSKNEDRFLRRETKMERILDAAGVVRLVALISGEILDEFPAAKIADLALVGIQLKGVPLALRIRDFIRRKRGVDVPLGKIDISMYRDDIGARRSILRTHETEIPFNVEGKAIVLVDDVLHTGRTIRAALDAITDYGRPAMIRLAVLVDRDAREFPIGADYAGLRRRFDAGMKISVGWRELGEGDSVVLDTIKKR